MNRTDPEPRVRNEAVRFLRNLLLGCLVLYGSFKYLTYAVLERAVTSYGTGAALTQVCLVWVIVFALALALTRRLPALLRFTRRDLGFLFIFLFVAGPLMMSVVYFTKMSTYVYYQGEKDPKAQQILEQDIPRLAPDDDAITSIYRGSRDGAVQWQDWFRAEQGMAPFLAWGPWLAFFLAMCIALVFILSRRWLEDEQLAFPLARMGELLVDGYKSPVSGERLPLLTTKAFWVGFLATFLFQMCTYLSPGLEWRIGSFNIPETVPLLGDLDYPSRHFWWRPVFLALFFLCPRRILGSALLFHVAQSVFTIIGVSLGYKGFTGSELPGATAFPFKSDQLVGGAIAMSAIMLWLSRHYLAAQLRALWRRARRLPLGPGERGAHSTAMAVFLLSIAGYLAWSMFIGFQLKTALFFLGCLLLATIINTRGRAETGMPMIIVFSQFSPFEFVSILGTRAIGLVTIAATAVHGWLFWNSLGHLTPSIMDSMKLGQLMRRSYRWVCWVVAAAIVLGLALGFVTAFDSVYEEGVNNWAYGHLSGSFQATTAARLMQKDVGFNWLHAGYSLGGALIVTGLWACRAAFPGFALHPMGYLLSLHSGLHHFSLALIVAYVVKTLSIHYGGMRRYVAFVPFFVGLLSGQLVGGVAGGILNAVFGTTVYFPMI